MKTRCGRYMLIGCLLAGAGSVPFAVSQAPNAAVVDNGAEGAAKEKAGVAEGSWLMLVDAAKWEESWKAASSAFRHAVTEEKWVAGIEGVRAPLGKVMHRELAGSTYSTHLPGVPDGAYVVSQFRTVFEHKAAATETIVAQRDTDGSWRISGYYIQ